jgi:delta1-piperideine-2-carboxylate reductase
LAHLHAFEPFAERVREFGSATMTIVNTYAFGTLWFEVEPLARNGFVVLACTNSRAYVTHPPDSRRVYGTNPMAFGWPCGNLPPLIFDQASSSMARGEIMLAAETGRHLPDAVAIDEQGLPTTDPETAMRGAQLPFGGYKGASVALMVELLSCALTGEAFSYQAAQEEPEDGGPQRGGVFMMAVDQKRFGAQETMQARANALFSTIRRNGAARLPSDRRYAARVETEKSGITISNSLHSKLLSFCGA